MIRITTHALSRRHHVYPTRIQSLRYKRTSSRQIVKADDATNALTTATNDDNNALTSSLTPINFDKQSSIQGEESQILEIKLEPNQSVTAETGAMIYMTENVEMNTNMGKDGVGGGFQRYITGQNLFISDFTYNGPEGTAGSFALGTEFPSKILRLNLNELDNELICQKGAFMASASNNVTIQPKFTKTFSAGFFGGEGFILQSLVGNGDVFVKGCGTIIKRDLEEGETLRISSGCLVAFTKHIDYDVQMMQGFKNVVFGGEGLFITTLKGPGRVWLQGMPPDRMISEIARRVPSGGIGLGIPIGMGGAGGGGETDGSDNSDGVVGAPDEADDSSSDNNIGSGDELAAASESAIETDRYATATSGASPIDSESPSALFGDVSGDDNTSNSPPINEDLSDDSDVPDFDSSTTTSFSDDDTNFEDDWNNDQFSDPADQFDKTDDQTSFSTEDQFSSFESEQDDGFDGGDDDEGGVMSILRSLYDMFSDDD